ncbi:MAG: hypothetical protein EOP45_09665 [Sphingobacteriaceae bacterium]|nr:MAG: hypothetical protein EOP45_09665 [Sphingobacteriaceae bacterium]
MKGYIYTTSVDPGKGVFLNDPIFDKIPTLGACMPNIRRNVQKGDYIFTVSGKTTSVNQYIIGGFEVESKIHALAALDEFPENVLRRAEDGTKRGNIIVLADGSRNPIDDHSNFEKRLDNYIIGKNPIHIANPEQVALARIETLGLLKSIFAKDGERVVDIIGRSSKMEERQVLGILEWLESIKKAS